MKTLTKKELEKLNSNILNITYSGTKLAILFMRNSIQFRSQLHWFDLPDSRKIRITSLSFEFVDEPKEASK